MLYGYARISRKTQNIERQIRNMIEYDKSIKIYQEAYTGTKTLGRKEWVKLLNKVGEGDTIVFDSVSRMSRNAEEGIETYFMLYDKGVNLVFLKESYINTDTYKESIKQTISNTGNEIADLYIEATNKVIKILAKKQIEKAFEQAEKEVIDLHKRTAEGLETAKNNGKRVGTQKGDTWETKKSIAMKDKIKKMDKAFYGNMTSKEVIDTLKLSRNTYFKYKKELKAEAEG